MSDPIQPAVPGAQPRPTPAPDSDAIKQRQRATWASGDYAVIGVTLQIVAESLAEAADVRANERVLDVAAGNGNATLAAARRNARVTATDYVPALLDKARGRLEADGLSATLREADAEDLPFADGEFDVALSTFGVMFAPDHRRAAGEMLRVVRGGGRIGLANWTPDGFIGHLFKTVGGHVPPPAGLQPPVAWGTEEHLRDLFGVHAQHISIERKMFKFRYASPAHWLEVFRNYYGPLNRAFAALDANAGLALEKDILALFDRFNEGGPGSLVVPSEYLEAVVFKRAVLM
ncbi:class I SAM-dependent methyltransferase [Massilia glaciei]|uniref:Class I SAM-dependent methyltransferase n=1 Tax=Massilia glaciei TaxID=1524097 RepID=A0A2U2HNL9_9BURK|nr:class I SAM-dependent methyltransferase [Massilia glaciei]PWF49100.1 class I SAM-dependent methyltransferase [Massilia glaciei]